MPDTIPKYLIELIPQFQKSLEDKYHDHNTILKFDEAAKTAIQVIKAKTGTIHKISASDIRRLVRYLHRQGAPIGVLADGCYWASTWAELEFSIGYVSGREKYYHEELTDLLNIQKAMEVTV